MEGEGCGKVDGWEACEAVSIQRFYAGSVRQLESAKHDEPSSTSRSCVRYCCHLGRSVLLISLHRSIGQVLLFGARLRCGRMPAGSFMSYILAFEEIDADSEDRKV